MRQESEVRFGARDLAPQSARLVGGRGPARLEVELEVADRRVKGRSELPPQAGGARDVDVEAIAGLLFPGMDATPSPPWNCARGGA